MELNQESPSKEYISDLRLTDGLNEYHIFNQAVAPDPEARNITFRGHSEAASFAERCIAFMHNEDEVRRFLIHKKIPVQNLFSRRELADYLAKEIVNLQVISIPFNPGQAKGNQPYNDPGETDINPTGGTSVPLADSEKIRFRFIDQETGHQVKGVAATIRLGDGRYREMVSDNCGEITWSFIKPGPCRLSSGTSSFSGATLENTLAYSESGTKSITGTAPLPVSAPVDDESGPETRKPKCFLATIVEHKVKEGETLSSVAAEHNMNFRELAYFNWGAYDRKTILQSMRRDIGCDRLTEAENDYHFESSNDPGVVFIPKPIEKSGFSTGNTYVVPVARKSYDVFAETLDVRIVDEDENPVKGVVCEFTMIDGSVFRKKTDENGVIRIRGLNVTHCKVRLIDYHTDELKTTR